MWRCPRLIHEVAGTRPERLLRRCLGGGGNRAGRDATDVGKLCPGAGERGLGALPPRDARINERCLLHSSGCCLFGRRGLTGLLRLIPLLDSGARMTLCPAQGVRVLGDGRCGGGMGIAGGQPLIRVRSELASERLGGATGPALEGIHAPQAVPSWPTALAWTGVAALAPRPVTACWMPSLMLFKLVSSILKPSDMATSYKARCLPVPFRRDRLRSRTHGRLAEEQLGTSL